MAHGAGRVSVAPLLMSAQELRALRGREGIKCVDCRHDLARPDWGESAYREAHLPGALFMHLDRHLSGPKNGSNGRHPLPSPAAFAWVLGAAGIGPDDHVIAYDDAGGMFACRLWWMLRWIGHAKVSVLDGGLQAWSGSGGELSELIPRYPARNYPLDMGAVLPTADCAQLLDNIDRPRFLVVDARAPDRFRGENESIDRVGGHIPGAINRFFRLNLEEDGRFKPACRLREEWGALLGERAGVEVIHQCGSGVTACHNLLALELAGWHGARLYPGSWSEWCADAARPMAC